MSDFLPYPRDEMIAKNRRAAVSAIDPKDKGTPDEWVPRHPDMVRLTGRHPFNVEPPLPKLMESGFLTPAALHYVRNHGAVPKCEWATHKLNIGGLVDAPTTFSMDDILSMPSRELPVTLVCAGNRRKEENLVKQTIGFSWGAAGVATSVWKGVLLRDVLLKCGVKKPSDGAHHVCFVGAEVMPLGRYGTSVPWHVAMDPACDLILAYEQNGERLTPDHGYPLRLIIPGYIGGRMIKWLTDISVTAEESDNHFHFMDNRVLPEFVDAERATAEGWWYKPDFIINELNINSAIAYPGHLEVVPLTGKGQKYTVGGYAYTGGGRKIIRVELSLDGGQTWTLTTIKRTEKPTEYGRHWCWVFWEHEVDVSDLFTMGSPGCEKAELRCRAWDAAMNRQPDNIVWNVMGMMNNSHFRIHIHRVLDAAGKPSLKFQHPTLAGPGNFGGWFEEQSMGKPGAAPAAAPEPVAASVKAGGKSYTMEEVAKHSTKDDCWFVVKGKVYDSTPFLEDHPGGASSILITAGTDCTEDFEALHSSKAWKMLDKYEIGALGDTPTTTAAPARTVTMAPIKGPVALDPKVWIDMPLIEREEINANTRRFRFGLATPTTDLGLPVGQHIFIKANVDGKPVVRAYTPLGHGPGYVDFVIKVYFPLLPRFPEGGKLTQFMDGMSLGDTLKFKGPLGEYIFNTDVLHPRTGLPKPKDALLTFTKNSDSKSTFNKLGLIAGGSGITPCLQVAHKLLKLPQDIEIWLLYANQTPADILCQPELDRIAKDPRMHVHYTVDRAPAGWEYSEGFINEAMCKNYLPPPSDLTYVFMCGPPPMLDRACKPNLVKLGYDEARMHCF